MNIYLYELKEKWKNEKYFFPSIMAVDHPEKVNTLIIQLIQTKAGKWFKPMNIEVEYMLKEKISTYKKENLLRYYKIVRLNKIEKEKYLGILTTELL